MHPISLRHRFSLARVSLNRITGIAIATLLLLLCFGALNPAILTLDNIRNILVQTTYLAIFAAAQTIVIIGGGFDLSLGATVSVVSVCMALVFAQGADANMIVPIGILAGMAVGAIIGGFNGIGVAFGKVNAFIMTLATLNILTSIATTISGGFPIQNLPADFLQISRLHIAGLPLAVLVAAVVFIGLAWLLQRTTFGHALFFIGSNADAARVAGIPVKKFTVMSYMLCSAVAAIGAILLTARTGSGEPNLGGDLTLGSIAASVVGGVKLKGGEGNIMSPIVGALLVTVFANGLNLLSVNGYIQQVLIGGVILMALVFDRERSR